MSPHPQRQINSKSQHKNNEQWRGEGQQESIALFFVLHQKGDQNSTHHPFIHFFGESFNPTLSALWEQGQSKSSQSIQEEAVFA